MPDKFQGGAKAGSVDVTIEVILRSTTDNTEVTGKIDSDVTASYQRQGTARTAITPVTQTVTGAHSDGGFVEIDATNMPGAYRFDVPDAAFATGVDFVTVAIKVVGSYVFYEKFNLTTNVVQTGDSFARLGAPTGASVSADLLVIDDFVDDLETRLTAVRAGYLDNLSAGAAALEATVAALNNVSSSDVQAALAAELDADGSELASVPTTTGTLRQKINFLFQYFRSRRTNTASALKMYKEDGTTQLGSATVSDDGTTFDKGELN